MTELNELTEGATEGEGSGRGKSIKKLPSSQLTKVSVHSIHNIILHTYKCSHLVHIVCISCSHLVHILFASCSHRVHILCTSCSHLVHILLFNTFPFDSLIFSIHFYFFLSTLFFQLFSQLFSSVYRWDRRRCCQCLAVCRSRVCNRTNTKNDPQQIITLNL